MSDGSRVYPIIGIGYVRTHPGQSQHNTPSGVEAMHTEMFGVFAGSGPQTNGVFAGYMKLQTVSVDPNANVHVQAESDTDGFRLEVTPVNDRP